MPYRFYYYKCVVDDGGAPCVQRGLLSLAICKPMIRKSAQAGDLIFAFGSNCDEPANRLVYIAKVEARLTDGAYYESKQYTNRRDCIYERLKNGRFRRRSDAMYHPSTAALNHDLGDPPDYSRANVLLCKDFRYFGDQGEDAWKDLAPKLARRIANLKQGHRVNHTPAIRQELQLLRDHYWKKFGKKKLGKPLHAANSCRTRCNPKTSEEKCTPMKRTHRC